MVAKNDITGDSIRSRGSSEAFRSNWDKIFNKKKIEGSSKGRIAVFEAANLGSNPSPSAIINKRKWVKDY